MRPPLWFWQLVALLSLVGVFAAWVPALPSGRPVEWGFVWAFFIILLACLVAERADLYEDSL